MNPRQMVYAAMLLAVTAAQAQVTTYDATTSVVTIPSVSVGTTTFTGVTLKNRGDFVFDLTGYAGNPSVGYPGVATYDGASGVLTLPAVKVGTSTFLDVTLRNVGNFVFTLQGATELPASVAAEVAAYARSVEAQTATALPPNGTARLALTDGCWASNGRTRANFIADYDANLAAYLRRDAYLVGRRIENIQVLALRNLVNPDGSARREIDAQWDVVYTDGTKAVASRETLISGSSAGTARCTTPQVGSTLRAMGNQQLLQTDLRANNLREERYSIATGAAVTPQVRLRREVQFQISDPMGNATHVVMTGPGPTNTIAGTRYPFSMKFLSPRLLRSAPELLGKPGNFVNWADDDSFRNCRMADGSVPVSPIVDCVANGATTNHWGIGFTDTPNAAADSSFEAQGWVAGGVYRFDVYNDDGWKTVNGQASRTPIATYYAELDRLPYRFTELTASDHPRITIGGGLTAAQVAANAVSATPSPLTLSWTRPALAPQQRQMQMFLAWEFHQGAKTGNASGVFNPAYRTLNRIYPGSTATSSSDVPVTVKQVGQDSKSYTEYNIYYNEPGTGNTIQSRIQFQ